MVGDRTDHQLQHREVDGQDVGPERALLLCPGHDRVDPGTHALAHLPLALGSAPGAQHHLTQSAVECLDLAHLLQSPCTPSAAECHAGFAQ
jgi:hypothetical protein